MKIFSSLVLAILLSGCAIENQYERAQRACVTIDTPTSYGSGFLVFRIDNESNKGRVFVWTAAHVVRGIDSADVIYFPRHGGHRDAKKTFRARVIARDSEDDLALLVIDAPAFSFWPARFEFSGEPVGTQVYDVGSVSSLDASVHTGIVSQKDAQPPGNLWKLVDQTSALVFPGFSGGAVYDENSGNVIGVVVGRIPDSNIGFFVPVREVQAFAKAHNVQFALDGIACPGADAIDALAALALTPPPVVTVEEGPPATSAPLPPKRKPRSEWKTPQWVPTLPKALR